MKHYRHNPLLCVLSMSMLLESMSLVAQAEFPLLRSSSSQEIKYFLTASYGSMNAKMVFVNSTNGKYGQLCYIDFSEVNDTPVVHSIAAVVNAKVPVISPDGQWVVYDTGAGGEAGNSKTMRSSVFICKIAQNATPVLIKADSASEPRFMQNVPQGLDTIIYSTLLPDFGWQDSGKTMKVGVDVTDGTPSIGTPQVLWNKGGYSGGQSWNKQFLCGGGGSIAMLDTKGTGKPDTITSYHQACNVSICASRLFNDRAMYLTSGDHDAQIKPDSIWRQWQIIFISDLAREVVRYYRCPTKFKFDPQTPDTTIHSMNSAFFWHHPEWSNHPYLAASTVNIDRAYFVDRTWKHTDYQERLYIVNLKDSVYLEVLRPQPQVFAYDPAKYSPTSGILWPWLWVQVPNGFQEDTAWLKTNRPNTSIRDGKDSKGHTPLIKLSGNSLSAISPIARISMYDLSGRKIATLSHTFIFGQSADLSSLSGNSTAVRFIRIECIDGTSAVIKLLRIRSE